MGDNHLTIKEALEILEISDLEHIDAKALSTIRRKAQRRWHPDTIAYTKPDEATVKKYERNFRLIDDALAVLNSYLRGETHVAAPFAKHHQSVPVEEPEEIIRRNASDLQASLARVWDRVKSSGLKMHEEVIVLSEGVLYRDLLMEDLRDNLPVITVCSLINGWMAYFIGILIVTFTVGVISQPLLPVTLLALTVLWAAQALACVIGFLPLSRYWLPDKLADAVIYLINFGMAVNRQVIESGLDRTLVISFVVGIPLRLAQLIKWIILFPLYTVAGVLLGDRRMGRVEERIKYYAGLAEWYIAKLIYRNATDLTTQELYDLSYLSSAFSEFEVDNAMAAHTTISSTAYNQSGATTGGAAYVPDSPAVDSQGQEVGGATKWLRESFNTQRTLQLGLRKWALPLSGTLVIGVIAYLAYALHANTQELARIRADKYAQEQAAQQEAAARKAAEQQAGVERQAHRDAAAREAEAQRRIQEEVGARLRAEEQAAAERQARQEAAEREVEALGKANQEAEAQRKAQARDAEMIAREQAVAERKASLEVEAKKRYESALARLEKSYQDARAAAERRYQGALANVRGRGDRMERAHKRYQDTLARAQSYYEQNRARVEASYQKTLKVQESYPELRKTTPHEDMLTSSVAPHQETTVDTNRDMTVGAPGRSAERPTITTADTYIIESVYLGNPKLNNTTERKVISVSDGQITVASKSIKSKTGTTRTLRFTPEWNLISSRNPDGGGLDYSPPLKYFEFPLYPGKTWRQTSVEKNITTNAVRDFTLSATVGEWEDMSVPAGTFRAIKVIVETELLDRTSGQKNIGKDISWYAPDLRRSVKSLVTSRDFRGSEEQQIIQMLKYDLR